MRLADRLTNIGRTTGARLDRLGVQFPPQREEMPLEEYLARASVHAQIDPQFAAQFKAAWAQYRAAQGVLKSGNS